MGVRFRLYGCERMRRERMIGECVVGFASLNLDTATTHLLNLEPRSNLSVSDVILSVILRITSTLKRQLHAKCNKFETYKIRRY